MNDNSEKKKIYQIEELIKAGKIIAARRELAKIQIKKLPRSDKLLLANLCRRSGDVFRSLRILKPMIDDETVLPTSAEISSYAAGLISIGADQEAIRLIRSQVKNMQSDALLHISLFHIRQWNYKSAVYFLKKYIRINKSHIYNSLIGQVNLISCYIVLNQINKAELMINKCKQIASKENFHFAMAQLYRMQTQIFLERKQYKLAYSEISHIINSEEINTISELINAKWLAVVLLNENPNHVPYIKKILKIKDKAIQLKSWETARDCDFHLATTSKDLSLLYRLYHGTSSIFFKQKIINELSADLKQGFIAKLDSSMYRKEIVLNCKEASLVYRLIQLLNTDNYRSFPIGEIFSKLYLDEKFNAISSVSRVFRLIQRTKQCLRQANCGVDILLINNQCKMINKTNSAIEFKPILNLNNKTILHSEKDLLAQLRKRFKLYSWTNMQIQLYLGISKSKVRCLLLKYLKLGVVRKIGSKRDGRYIFNNYRKLSQNMYQIDTII